MKFIKDKKKTFAKILKLSEAETAIFDNDFVEEISGSVNNSQLVVTSLYVYVCELQVYIRLGMLVDDYVPVTVIYDSFRTEDYISLNDEDIVKTVYTIYQGKKSYKEVEDMTCYIFKFA